MSRLDSLKLFVKQRLSAALDDIFQHVDKTITEFEHELLRSHRKLLDDAISPETEKRRADVQLLLDPPEQQEWSSSLDQEDPELPHIKEEQEELWSSQQLEELKEEEEEDEAPPSQLHQSQTEPLTCSSAEADEADCAGPEPARNSDPDGSFAAVSEEKVVISSEAETEVSDEEWKESKDTLDSVGVSHVPVSKDRYEPVKKSFICCECGRKFGRKDSLRRHMRFHTGEKPYSCSVCGKRFSQRPNLIRHMRCHSGEKPFSCSFCDVSFAVRSALVNHMRIHTGEKPFSCLYCHKSFTQKGGLKKHMTVHTGEKPYSCPACDKSFSQKANLTYHFSVHTGQKQFSCSVCDKRFTWQSQVKSHKCVGESSST